MKRAGALLMAALAAGACGGGREVDPEPIPASWIADIAGGEGSGTRGFVTMSVLPSGQTRVNATLSGVQPEGEYEWSVRQGTCGEDGAAVDGDYPILRANPNGYASATATLTQALSVDEDYHVEVRDEAAATPIGCGQLTSS